NCVDGITANEEQLADTVARSVTVITALAPVIGYAEAAKLAKEALAEQRPIRELVTERGLLGAEELEEILQPAKLAGLAPDAETAVEANRVGDRAEVDITSALGEG
ncbi:MAG: hypothetical protein Q4C71_06390, partial [Microbacteriaceae bacterium]|nr:hypothetical protein [Microbacteriaceae bacterium]